MQRKYALNTDAIYYLAHGKGGGHAAPVFAGEHHAFKSGYALLAALLDLLMHAHRIARPDFGQIGPQLSFLQSRYGHKDERIKKPLLEQALEKNRYYCVLRYVKLPCEK